MIVVEILSGRWDGLHLQLPLEGPPVKLIVTDDGIVMADEREIGTVKEFEERE